MGNKKWLNFLNRPRKDPEYLIARSQYAERGPLVRSYSIFDGNRPLEHTPDIEKVQSERIPFINRWVFQVRGMFQGYVGIFLDTSKRPF